MNFILEGKIKQTVMYTYSTIMNFISEGKLCFTETKRLCRITLYTAQVQAQSQIEKGKRNMDSELSLKSIGPTFKREGRPLTRKLKE